MRWIDIGDVYTRNVAVSLIILQDQGIEKPTLIEVEPIYLVSRCRKVGIT